MILCHSIIHLLFNKESLYHSVTLWSGTRSGDSAKFILPAIWITWSKVSLKEIRKNVQNLFWNRSIAKPRFWRSDSAQPTQVACVNVD